ncbi:uncharacterized protein LOC143887387 [Tasmannia lanceolata]|uniref:uncharacterized protein LOC143887387 n=1 Tax=Tasmannia lanceolata TaxID=3420 RepID=UPI00406361B6
MVVDLPMVEAIVTGSGLDSGGGRGARARGLFVFQCLDALGPEFLPIHQLIVGLKSISSLDEVFSWVQRSLRVEGSSELFVELGGDRGGNGGRSSHGRGHRDCGSGLDSGGGRGARARGSRFHAHCCMEGHPIDHCYDLHLELWHSRYANRASVSVPMGSMQLSSGQTKQGDSLVVSRAEYDDMLRSKDKDMQPTAPLAQQDSSFSCFLIGSRSWLIDSEANDKTNKSDILSSF